VASGVLYYTTSFERNQIVHDLRAYDAVGSATRFIETWKFAGASAFVWTLLRLIAAGMSG
jgi:hypothetical protein